MADNSIRDVSDRGSPEYVAYLLMKEISFGTPHETRTTQKWVFDTYANCLKVVTGRSPSI